MGGEGVSAEKLLSKLNAYLDGLMKKKLSSASQKQQLS
jgi:hypothetical protein